MRLQLRPIRAFRAEPTWRAHEPLRDTESKSFAQIGSAHSHRSFMSLLILALVHRGSAATSSPMHGAAFADCSGRSVPLPESRVYNFCAHKPWP
eukprot:1164487-Rhodomonas_salina.1